MAQDTSKWRTLYDNIKDDYELPDYDTFKEDMERPGDDGYQNRLMLFNLVKDTHDVGESYEEFAGRLGLHPVSSANTPQNEQPQQTTVAPIAQQPTAQQPTQVQQAAQQPTQAQPTTQQQQTQRQKTQEEEAKRREAVEWAAKKKQDAARNPKKPKEPTAEEKAAWREELIANAQQNLDAPDQYIVSRDAGGKPTQTIDITTKTYTDRLVSDLYRQADEKKMHMSESSFNNPYDELGIQSAQNAIAANMVDDPQEIERQAIARVKADEWTIKNNAAKQAHELQAKTDAWIDVADFAEKAYERTLVDTIAKVRNMAIEREKPKSTYEGFMRSAAGTTGDLANALTTTPGHVEAKEQAMAQWGKEQAMAQTAGTVAGMAADPSMLIGTGAATMTGKLMTNVVAKKLFPTVGKEIAARYLSMSPKYMMAQRAVQGGVNFGTFSAISTATNQLAHDRFNGAEILGKGLEEGLTGVVVSGAGAFIGNATSNAVRNASSRSAALANRVAGTGVGIGTEISIFAGKDILMNGEDAEDAYKNAVAMVLGFKVLPAAKGALGAVGGAMRSPRTREEELSRKGFWRGMVDRITATPETGFTETEKDELRRYGYDDLADMSHKDYASSAIEYREPKGLIGHDKEVTDEGTTVNAAQNEYFDRVAQMIGDTRLSETARAKMAYVVTGEKMPMSSVLGSAMGKTDDGKYYVEATGVNGVISHRVYDNEAAARRAQAAVDQQATLNTVVIGERYKTADVDGRQLDNAMSQVAREMNTTADEVRRLYDTGDDPTTKRVKELYDAQEAFYAMERPEGIRTSIKDEYGVDVDDVIRKDADRRTDDETDALREYVHRLYPKEEGQQEGQWREGLPTNEGGGTTPPDDGGSEMLRYLHEDGTLHKAKIYPKATEGGHAQPHEVFIVKGDVVLRDDGSVDPEASSDMIIYVDENGERHEASAKMFTEIEEPVTEEEVATSEQQSQPIGATTQLFVPDQTVRFNINGQEVEGIVTDAPEGTGYVTIRYEDANGDIHQSKVDANDLAKYNGLDVAEQTTDEATEQPTTTTTDNQQPTTETTAEPLAGTDTGQPLQGEPQANLQGETLQPTEASVPTGTQEGQPTTGTQEEQPGDDLHRKELELLADTNGNITPITVKHDDGTEETLFYKAGDLNNKYGGVHAVDVNGNARQVAVKDIVDIGDSTNLEDELSKDGEDVKKDTSTEPAALTPIQELDGMLSENDGDMSVTAGDIGKTVEAISKRLANAREKASMPIDRTDPKQVEARKQAMADVRQLQQQLDHWKGVQAELTKRNSETVKQTAEEQQVTSPESMDEQSGTLVKGSENSGSEESEPQPIGTGIFGKIYNQFKGKVKEAFKFLASHKHGDLLGVYHRDDIGDIDLIWGDDKGGIQHIIRRHIIEQNDFKTIEDIENAITEVINHGTVIRENPDRIALQTDKYKVTINKQYRDEKGNVVLKKNWVVTAFDRTRKKGEKKNPPRGTLTTPSSNPAGTDGVTLPSNGLSSADKDTQSSDTEQENEGKSAQKVGTGYVEQETVEAYAKDFPFVPDDTTKKKILGLIDSLRKSVKSRINDTDAYSTETIRTDKFYHSELETLRQLARTFGMTDELEIKTSPKVTWFDAENGVLYSFIYENPKYKGKNGFIQVEIDTYKKSLTQTQQAIAEAEQHVDTNPSEAQKKANNYGHGHVKVDGYDISIENPKGSARMKKDENGNILWQNTMHNTYGYIRGTEGTDGDHIDVFLSDDPEQGNVYVIDQVNPETGEFDEHKVMYGFGSIDEAREAYLSNYEKGWKGLGTITEVSKEEFKKWINSSHRKTKPFAEYKSITPLSPMWGGVEDSDTEKRTSTEEKYEQAETDEKSRETQKNDGNNGEGEKKVVSLQSEERSTDEQRTLDGRQGQREARRCLDDAKADDDGGGDGTTVPVGRSGGTRKQSLLRDVVRRSKESKTWIEDVGSITQRYLGHGAENEVYLSADGSHVLKLNNFLFLSDDANNFDDFTNRIDSHNELFPDVPLRVEGFALNDKGEVCVVLSQPYLKDVREASDAEVDKYLEDRDFYTDISGNWTDGNFMIADAKSANVFVDKNGNMYFFDTVPYDYRRKGKPLKVGGRRNNVEQPQFEEGESPINYAQRLEAWRQAQEKAKTPTEEKPKSEQPKSEQPKTGQTQEEKVENGKTVLYQKGSVRKPTPLQRKLGEAIVHIMRKAGIYVSLDVEEARKALLKGDAQYQKAIDVLSKAADYIRKNLGHNAADFDIAVPEWVEKKVRAIMNAGVPKEKRKKIKGHRLSTSGLNHAYNNHGDRGSKIEEEHIPLTKEDMTLAPYIMMCPDDVVPGNIDSNRKSVRYVKYISNGVIVYVEAEQGLTGEYLETKNMWADLSPTYQSSSGRVRGNMPSRATSETPMVSTEDAAKIRKDAETAIANERILQKMTVYHGSPYSFEQFDHSHMGEGEGRQAHGWGTYVAKDKEIGIAYAERYGDEEEAIIRITGNDYNLYQDEWYTDDDGQFHFNLESDVREDAILHAAADYFGIDEDQLVEYTEEDADSLIEEFRSEIQNDIDDIDVSHNLYEVEIPDDTGDNYLDEQKRYTSSELKDIVERVKAIAKTKEEKKLAEALAHSWKDGLTGGDIYEDLADGKNSNHKLASEILNKAGFAGIKYNGRQDGECYVIFNEKDLKIKSHEQFLKTKGGETYGFVVDGKMYIDPTLLNPNTPIHEYGHLWTNALMKAQPELWAHGKEMMKELPLWEEVRNDENYADIKDDEDLVASEVFSRLLGEDGEKRLDDMVKDAAEKGSPIDVAKTVTLAQRIKEWLKKALMAVRSAFGHKWTKEEAKTVTLEELKGMALNDFAEGFNPTEIAVDENGVQYSKVTDTDLKKMLEAGPKVKVYRAMQLIDGKLYPPMATRIKGEDGKKHLVEPIKLGEWEQADEHPELATKDGKFILDKANGSTVPAAYNPYIHTSRSPLNDQFSSAYKRPNLVTVEVEVPESELTSGYKAEKAKDAVGEMDWHSGPVSSKLAKAGDPRKVILSRYDKPVRIIPDAEVAEHIAEKIMAAEAKLGEKISIPVNTVTPSLRQELEKLGVSVSDKDSGVQGKAMESRDETKEVHPTLLQTSNDVQAVQRGRLPGTKVEINSENRKEIERNLSDLAQKVEKEPMKAEDFLTAMREAMKTESNDHSGYNEQNINGENHTLRVSDHHAGARNLVRNHEFKVSSIVVKTPYSDNRFRAHKDVEMVEFVFDADKLTHENQKDIVKAMREWMDTGVCDIVGATKIHLSPKDANSAAIATVAQEHRVSVFQVKAYAEAMKAGDLSAASRAVQNMVYQLANKVKSLKEFSEIRKSITQDLSKHFGDVEELRKQHVEKVMQERGAMEAARKRAEAEAEKERKRLEEFERMDGKTLDAEYFKAIEAGDEKRVRDLVNEAARRKGYGDTASDYQGEGAWAAPSNPGYETAEERRHAMQEDTVDVNIDDIANGISPQPDDVFSNPRAYGHDTPEARESIAAIQKAINETKAGRKAKVKVYRAVPTDIKEGKVRNGDWVTPSRKYAEMHGKNRLQGKYRIIEQEVPADELWWDGNDVNEWGYDDGKSYAYGNRKNNRKLNDLITRDDKGNIIPLSKRFDERKEDVRYRLDDGPETFEERQKKAVESKGTVMPGLNEAEVKVVDVDKDIPFDTNKKTKELRKDVVKYAQEHGIMGKMMDDETNGKGEITISNNSIGKMVDDSATNKSVDRDTHLAIIPKLRDVIRESVLAETHPDYLKGEDGVRRPENGHNPDVLIHRCYGAVNIGGRDYRVKITLKENVNGETPRAYSYEVTKIEVLDGQTSTPEANSRNSNTSVVEVLEENSPSSPNGVSNVSDVFVTGAKLLQGVEKSYEKGKKLLEESEKSGEKAEYRETEGQKDGAQRKWKSYAERSARNAINAMKDLARKLHLDNVEIITDINDVRNAAARRALEAGRAVKGWYDPETGKIYVFMPTHTSGSDLIRTLLHEGVAHHGLRQLFGEHFDTFLDNVYNNVTREIRDNIDARVEKMREAAKSKGKKFDEEKARRTSTEEYLADLAEDSNFENAMKQGWWQKIKNLFLDLLAKVGIRLSKSLTDADLRYILWRSYENLKEPGRYRSPIETARDVAMQDRLGVGNYQKGQGESGIAAEEPTGEYGQHTAEERAIVERAKADGTYMKAPNGKPTKLTPKQWAQVRTKAFKEWFGDWELQHKTVENVSIDSTKEDVPTTRESAIKLLDTMEQPFHNNDQGVDIYVSHRDARHTMQFHNNDQIKVIAGIERLINNAVKIGEEPVSADEKETTKAVHVYYCPVEIDGTQYSARMVVKEYYEGSMTVDELHLYNAMLKKQQPANTLSLDGTPHMRQTAVNRYKVSDLIHSTQDGDKKMLESSKIVDENGEPLVVYHSTNADFNIFKHGDIGSHFGTLYQAKQRFQRKFIRGSVERDNMRIMSEYVSIKSPLVFDEDIPSWNGDNPDFWRFLILKGVFTEEEATGLFKDAANISYKGTSLAALYEAARIFKARLAEKREAINERLRNALIGKGYDGIIYRNQYEAVGEDGDRRSFIAFKPNQIKSATDNNGDFSTNDDDIRFRDSDGETSRTGKSTFGKRNAPRKRKDESMAQFTQRLREYEKQKVAYEAAEAANDPMPRREDYIAQVDKDFDGAMSDWKKAKGIEEGKNGPGPFPKRGNDESPQDYAIRVADYESENDAWKDAPDYMDYLKKADTAYRADYEAWRKRYDLSEAENVDIDLYEGKHPSTDADTEGRMDAELSHAAGIDTTPEGAKRRTKIAVIERRKNMESMSAEDALFINDITTRLNGIAAGTLGDKNWVAKGVKESRVQKEIKKLRKAIPYLIEADRRRKDIAEAFNVTATAANAHLHLAPDDIMVIQPMAARLRSVDNRIQTLQNMADDGYDVDPLELARLIGERADVAREVAMALNNAHEGDGEWVPLSHEEVVATAGILSKPVLPSGLTDISVTPELQKVIDDIGVWYEYFYGLIEDAGLRGRAGHISGGYVNHVWDKERSDPKAYAEYVENFQRVKSPNMRTRTISTYIEGEELGLVPKFDDISALMAYYSRSNIEAVSNKRFLDDLSFINVDEVNGDGEVVRSLPMLSSEKPDEIDRDRYSLYYVPGVGDVYVVKDVQRRFASVFGNLRTADIPDWMHSLGHGYDIAASTAKKIQLSFSAFHAGALTEVALAQMRPDRGLRAVLKYVVYDSLAKGTIPAYAHPEDFKDAAAHLVQLGATQDYAAADVNAFTEKVRDIVKKTLEGRSSVVRAGGKPLEWATELLVWVNKGMDKLLWNYLHDGLKIASFKMFKEQIEQRCRKQGLDEATKNKLLDEAGQYVNDCFGGQYWELLNVTPAAMKWMRRALLSPDWLVSTQRHFAANFGFGSIYSDGGFREYLRYNADNIRRALGSDVPHDELRRLRSSNAKKCYIFGVCVFFYAAMNALNAFFRKKDEEEQNEKAEKMRENIPDYKSPYELAYPDGMKWYDYTMWGNAMGQQTHLFSGRYDEGSETYLRWGKQFREFPEMFIGRKGFDFPTPMIERLMGKSNPMIGTAIDVAGALDLYSFNSGNETKEIRAKYGKQIAALAVVARHYMPFSVPTQEDKNFKMVDLVMPSQKGFTRYKTIDYFKDFVKAGNMAGVERTYKAAVMNGIDAEKCLDAAITTVKAEQKNELRDGVTDLPMAFDKYDKSHSLAEKKTLKNKIEKLLAADKYTVFTKKEAQERVLDFINGNENNAEQVTDRYLMLTTASDIRDDYRLNCIGKTAKEYANKVKQARESGNAAWRQMAKRYEPWLRINDICKHAKNEMGKQRKNLGAEGNNDGATMDEIRRIRADAQKAVDGIGAPK